MTDDRLMNEYEGALFSALMALTKAVVLGKTGRSELAAIYGEAAIPERTEGRHNGAAVLEILARLAEEDRYYSPTMQPFQVIPGGKSDDDTSD